MSSDLNVNVYQAEESPQIEGPTGNTKHESSRAMGLNEKHHAQQHLGDCIQKSNQVKHESPNNENKMSRGEADGKASPKSSSDDEDGEDDDEKSGGSGDSNPKAIVPEQENAKNHLKNIIETKSVSPSKCEPEETKPLDKASENSTPLDITPKQPSSSGSSEEEKKKETGVERKLIHKKKLVEDAPLEDTLTKDEFQKQLHKWGHHHNLPVWAEQQLFEHMTHELERRKEMNKYYQLNCSNIFRPWRWSRMWHQRHLHCKGDIAFPVHGPMAGTSSDGSPNGHSLEDDEVLMTDDLAHEIMEDDSADSGSAKAIERAGLQGIEIWSSVAELKARNPLFQKLQVHENTIRSIALVNPKPGDPYPGRITLRTPSRVRFATYMMIYTFKTKKKTGSGIVSTKRVKTKNHRHK